MFGVYSQQASGGGVSVPEVIIIGGTNNRIFRSTDDGLTFTTQIVNHPSHPSANIAWDRVLYCNGKFFISCISSTYGGMVSHDYGLTWENIINNERMRSIVWNGTYYFACIDYQIRRSADLVTWTNLTGKGFDYQIGDDLTVVGDDVYWSTNRSTSSPVSFLGIQKCVAPYNQANVSSINVPNAASIPNGTFGELYKTSNGLILTSTGGGSQQRVYSTTNYTSLTAAIITYITSQDGLFHIVVGEYAYRFGNPATTVKGYGSPVITALSTTTSPNNGLARSVDTNGSIFIALSNIVGVAVWTRDVTANSTAWTSTNIGFGARTVFYTGKSFLVMDNTQLIRSVTGTSGWSTAITPFGSGSWNENDATNIASSYKI